jgi:DoxX-like family
MKTSKVKNIAYWVTTVLGPTSFVIGGVIGLTGGEQVAASLNHLGYPVYFASLLGAWKLLGAIVLTVPGLPRLKEWAYAGFVFDLTAAAFSHTAVGDAAGDVIGPLVFLGLVLASWALRPASRKLASNAMHAGTSNARAGDRLAVFPVHVGG